MVQTPIKPLRLEEFLTRPETKPASEYIDGKIIKKPMSQGEHSTIQTELSTKINVVLKPRHIGRAFSELRCTFGGRSIVPDVAVFVRERIPRKANGGINAFELAPDGTIEILSPDQSPTKVIKNILHCLNHETQMGWPIDPDEQTVFVYLPKQQPQVFDASDNVLPVPSFASELRLTVGELFAWLME
jgi:Uma2 family endonuclease